MIDPLRNPAFESSFSFTGTITRVEKDAKTMHLLIHQDAAGGRMPTDYKLVIPLSAVLTEEFPYMKGDTVLVEDALLYTKASEIRLRISDMAQIRATTAQPWEVNALSYSGEIVEVKEEAGFDLVLMKQTYKETFTTTLEVMIPKSLKMEESPKAGDIGYIKSAVLYDKQGQLRAKITRPTYKILYTPDAVMCLGTIEAKELFV